jgi:hypothetical protein
MRFKSALQLFIDPIIEESPERELNRTNPKAAREEYIQLTSGANKSVKIVAGEANRQLFNEKAFVDGLRTFLSHNPKGTFKLICHKDDDRKVAEEMFKKQNKLLVDLKHDIKDRVQIFWVSKRPHQHYAVIDDGRLAILEEPDHKPFAPFDGLVTYDKNWAHEWSKRFDKYLDHCRASGRCQEMTLTA